MGKRETKTRRCSKAERIYFIDPEDGEYKGTIKNGKEKVGSSNGGGNAWQEKEQRSAPAFRRLKRRVMHPTRFPKTA